jgi:hypothetical protein
MSTRDNNGRFTKGNSGGQGRPPRSTELDYLASLSEGVPKQLWMEIIHEAVARAKSGDAKARDWISRYLLPRDNGHHLHELAMREKDAEGNPAVQSKPGSGCRAEGEGDSHSFA